MIESSLTHETNLPELTTISLINEKSTENSNKKIDEELSSVGETTISSVFEVTSSTINEMESEESKTNCCNKKNLFIPNIAPIPYDSNFFEGIDTSLIHETILPSDSNITSIDKDSLNENTLLFYNYEKNTDEFSIPVIKNLDQIEGTKNDSINENDSVEVTTILTSIETSSNEKIFSINEKYSASEDINSNQENEYYSINENETSSVEMTTVPSTSKD